jgi:phosphate transport system protein
MSTTTISPQSVYQDALVNYLVSMARAVETTVGRAMRALLERDVSLASQVLLNEPRINEMEIIIDEQAVRLLRAKELGEERIRLIVATLKINNDLERMGDLAVNISQRVVSLAEYADTPPPADLAPMAQAVRAMVSKSLGALICRNTELANQVLESDDVVDHYRDIILEQLLAAMTEAPARTAPHLQFVLAARHLERIADHATNIAEDVVFWVRGLDVRHGRGLLDSALPEPSEPSHSERV